MNKKALVIGAGIAGPAMAIQLQRLSIESELVEARSYHEMNEGLFMGLTPNGLNALGTYIDLAQLYEECTPGKMEFYNARNKPIGELNTADQPEKYGAATVQVKRARVSELLRSQASSLGISIHYNQRLTGLAESRNGVTASFGDGRKRQADFLIACDGTHSRCRAAIFPDAPQPAYTRQLSTGAITSLSNVPTNPDSINMIFGRRAFFAYAVSNTNQIWWFNNFYRETLPSREEIQTTLPGEIKSHLLRIHQGDPAPILDIIQNTDAIFAYPVYEMPALKKWYTPRVCLIGDAAHATAPHIGQGASLALEDTLVLAQCLKQQPDLEKAFHHFQQQRKPRVDNIVKQARKVGNVKATPHPVATFFRDLLLSQFIRAEQKKLDWVYRYRADQL